MAGYYGYSKSNNALAAEENGMLPLSRISGAPRWAIKLAGELQGADEWHHTSKMYNKTYYYDVDKTVRCAKSLVAQFGKKAVAREVIEKKRRERMRISLRAERPSVKYFLNCRLWTSNGENTGMTYREAVAEMRSRGMSMTGENFNRIAEEYARDYEKRLGY